MSRAASLALIVLAIAALTASAGCAGTVRSASRAAVPVVVDESLGAFEDPITRRRFEQILGSPEMQGALEATARGLLHGAVEPGSEERVRALTAAMTDAVAEALAHDIPERLLPATVDGMRAQLREALSPEDRRALMDAVDGAITQAIATAIRSASVELPRTFVPAIVPAMRGALVESLNSPDLHAAVAGVTADAIRAALISSRQLIIELHDQSEGNGPIMKVVDRMQRMVERTVVVTFCIGALLGGIAVWASRHFRRGSGSGPPGPAPSEPASSQEPQDRGPSGQRAPARLDPSATRAT